MIIKTKVAGYDRLAVKSNIYFDNSTCVCGRPYLYLIAHKDRVNFWKAHSIGIALHDQDDFDIGLIYETDEKHFFDVLHELINWMRDHEQGITRFEDVFEPLAFFPDLGCKRIDW